MTPTSQHKQFVAALKALAKPAAVSGVTRFFRADAKASTAGNKILGVPFGKVFQTAKQYAEMPLTQIETLLDSPYYEIRMGAVSIMDFQARAKRSTPEHRQALFDLYMRRHDRINNWDLVDRAAPHVVGGYLADKSRKVLYELARSDNPCKRRTAIVSTYYFIRAGEVDDTFGIAELLVRDEHDLVQKAVGSWIREAGKKDQRRLVRFLATHGSAMSATMFRYAAEKLPARTRARLRA